MADVEVKRKGRPKKREPEAVEVKSPAKKAPATVSNGDDGGAAPPAKRGRGRPPKGGVAAPKKVPVPGRGRGRPPKKTRKKKQPVEEEEENDDDDEDEEKKESEGEEADSS